MGTCDLAAREKGMAKLDVYLDLGDGGCMAHVLGELLGCNQTARTRERALIKLERDVAEYAATLRASGEAIPFADMERIDLSVVEVSEDQDPWIAGGTNALFGPEMAPVTPADIASCLRRLETNRSALLDLVRNVPAAGYADCASGEPRSVANTLSHIADADLWYLSRLGRDLAHARQALPTEPIARLEAARAIVIETLPALDEAERRQVFVPTIWCSPRQLRLREPWTARKVLRRLLEHERQHAQYIRRIAAAGGEAPNRTQRLVP